MFLFVTTATHTYTHDHTHTHTHTHSRIRRETVPGKSRQRTPFQFSSFQLAQFFRWVVVCLLQKWRAIHTWKVPTCVFKLPQTTIIRIPFLLPPECAFSGPAEPLNIKLNVWEYDAVLGTIKKGSVVLWPVYLPKLTNLICINAGTCFINGILNRHPMRKWLHYPGQLRTNGSQTTATK